jgi:hypothetical protein
LVAARRAGNSTVPPRRYRRTYSASDRLTGRAATAMPRETPPRTS